MKNVKIKGIPENETYLFATIGTICYRAGLLRLPQQKRVKIVLTEEGLYLKIHGVLIDTTGAIMLSIEDFESLTIIKRTSKKGKFCIAERNGQVITYILKQEECDDMINKLKNLNPNMPIIENA